MPDIPRRVLVVETEKEGRAVLEAVLAAQGYEVHAAAHARRALDLCRTGNFDVAIVDLAIPGADGDPLWCGLRDSDPDLSIILVTSEADIDSAYDAIDVGAYDYLVEPLAHQEVTLRVDRAAERHELLALSRICQQDLESRIDERTHQISDGMQRLEASLAETRQARLEAVCLLSHISELHDECTGNHLRRVSCYCQEVARGISCDEEFIEQITYSSPLHDIGKISTPPEILRKPGKLTPDEFEITSGNKDLDRMCGGGFFRDSIILVSGATGAGKTLLTTEFIAGAAEGERSLLFAFEESREQFFRNAIGWGIDLLAMEDAGRLEVVCEYPEVAGPEDRLIRMKSIIEEFKPSRVAVDSLSAFEPVSTRKSSREFVIGLTSFIKHKEIAGLFTATTPTLVGGTSTTDAHMFPITDSIILLRYVELFGEMRRAITVLKMRGSMHDKDIREFSIDGDGMHIGKPLRNVIGILAGNPTIVMPREAERVADLFKEEAAQT
jgi:KaiC/GvpD/RAD55 family RecA-like ATPase/DNA-binding response OmpR family regulator